MKDHVLAKRYFIAGTLGLLPWLSICNVLYFRRSVYGNISWLDGDAPIPDLNDSIDDSDDSDDDDDNSDEEIAHRSSRNRVDDADVLLSREEEHAELCKW
eukprot:CAMPEP_0113310212 /NCGR_PEP_ID=MMETSP0010_2-20120614/7950_1 /TAXON_ID=216773 ORGANISM="Corethron hystrix, Strain 308" /NCGR_SAMPLE_ID=MMETSP0010_2 /ASSEMBLY_ACC=CAM_ASM_000155 /LENGTH=99 /DNA_ID=CAMNT_0000165627 /DNA_START=216 /DNA_END=512 /DNA_ORIENTATION=+ /assembly_acc=CAM_ASM_000155